MLCTKVEHVPLSGFSALKPSFDALFKEAGAKLVERTDSQAHQKNLMPSITQASLNLLHSSL